MAARFSERLRRENRHRIAQHGNFGGQSAENLSVGFNIDGQVAQRHAFHVRAVNQLNSADSPACSDQPAHNVMEILDPALGVEKNQTQIVAVQRRAWSKFAQHSSEVANADRKELRHFGLSKLAVFGRKLNAEGFHIERKPEPGRLRVIRQHTETYFQRGIQSVK